MTVWGILHSELGRTQKADVVARRALKKIARLPADERKAAVRELIEAALVPPPTTTVVIVKGQGRAPR